MMLGREEGGRGGARGRGNGGEEEGREGGGRGEEEESMERRPGAGHQLLL